MNSKSEKTAIAYFVIHALVEVVCFATLYNHYDAGILWIAAILYDAVAFVPQGAFGVLINRFRRKDFGTVGVVLMLLSLVTYNATDNVYAIAGIVVMALGNAILHECGAVATVSVGNGKLFPPALFVGGGSFGVIAGQLMGKAHVSGLWLVGCLIVIELLVLWTNKEWLSETIIFPRYRLVNESCPAKVVLLVAFLVTAVRSFIGYAIPTLWKKEVWQAVLLFVMMGLGKAFGGFLVDKLKESAKLVGCVTTLLAIPFLVFGAHVMVISIIGVFLFSMTMSITFGMILSIMPQAPGLAFGITTVGLFVGCIPMFAFGTFSEIVNVILVSVLSVICFFALLKTAK